MKILFIHSTDCRSDDILNGEIPIQRVKNKYLPQSEQQIYNASFPGGSPDNKYPHTLEGNSSKGTKEKPDLFTDREILF